MAKNKSSVSLFYSYLESRPTFSKAGSINMKRVQFLITRLNNHVDRIENDYQDTHVHHGMNHPIISNCFFINLSSQNSTQLEEVLEETLTHVGIPYRVEGNYNLLDKTLECHGKKTYKDMRGLFDSNRKVVDL